MRATVASVDDAAPTLQVLHPQGRPSLPPDPAEQALGALFDEPRSRWVRANMVATLDGAATGADHRSGSINDPADLRVFRTLRARADIVLVGAGTVRAEGYRAPRTPEPLRAGRRDRGQPDHPALAVLTASGDLPVALLTDDPAPWVFTTSDAAHLDRLSDHLPPERLHVHDGVLPAAAALEALSAAGLGRILTEGGPHLLAELVTAGLVDELCLTWSPQLVGGSATRVLAGTAWLVPPRQARLAHLLHADGVLLGRWLLGPTDAG
jgi:riboflavin biosynthesis pyrimidine reductase